MPQFDSGAAKQIGRFSEGLLLRLLHRDIHAKRARSTTPFFHALPKSIGQRERRSTRSRYRSLGLIPAAKAAARIVSPLSVSTPTARPFLTRTWRTRVESLMLMP